MTINYTTLLGLAKPVTGTETGQWGDVVNDEITSLLEDAVANAATFSVTSGNVTLTTTNGASNQARMSTLIITGTPGTTRNVIAPSQAKVYQVINQSDGAVVIKGAATTGVTIAAGATGTVVWNGTDFVEINSTSSGRIINGNLQVTGNLQVDGNTTLGNAAGDSLTINAGTTTLNQGTANGVAYLNGSKVLTTGSALTYNGTTLALSGGSISNANSGNENYLLSDGTNRSSIQQAGTPMYFNANDNTASGGQFVWRINSALSEQMRLTSTGLGIGTSSPAARLHVVGGTAASLTAPAIFVQNNRFLTFQNAAGNSWAAGMYADSSDNFAMASLGYTAFFTGPGPTERMRLDASGNLGLGVTPSAWGSGWPALQVGSRTIVHSGPDGRASFGNNYYVDGTNARYIASAHATQLMQVSGDFRFFTAPSGTAGNAISFTQAMTLDADAILAVSGTRNTGYNAAFKLQVGVDTGTQGIMIRGAETYLSFDDGVNSFGTGRIYYNAASDYMAFSTAAIERARINSSGEVLLGTSGASGSLLIINGVTRTMRQGDRTDLSFQTDNTVGAPTWPQRNLIGHYYTGVQDAVSIRVPSSSNANTASYDILQDGTHIWYAAGGSNITGSTATVRARITPNGDFNIGASATNRLRLVYDGVSGQATIGPDSSGGNTFTVFGVSNGGSFNEAARITNTGALLVNTTTANGDYVKYAMNGATMSLGVNTTGSESSLMNAGAINNVLLLRAPFGASPEAGTNADAKWGIMFWGASPMEPTYPFNTSQARSVSFGKNAAIYAYSDETNAGYNRAVGLQLWTTNGIDGNAVERVRINRDGNVLIGSTSDSSARLRVNFTNMTFGIRVGTTATSGNAMQFVYEPSTQVGGITITTSSTSYNTSSDYRLKNSVTPMIGALAKVMRLNPVTYKWNIDDSDGEGFIAHELAEICPQAVSGEKDAVNEDGSIKPQGIDTSFLVATLTAAIQELKAEFDAYKATHP